MYEALEGTSLVTLVAIGVYALTQQPDPELLTPEPNALSLRWPDRFRPGHRRAAGETADTEADDFIEALHEPGPQPGGRHRRPGPPSMKLSRDDLPSTGETIERAPAPGHPPWDTIPGQSELVLRTCNEPRPWHTFRPPVLGAEAATTQDPPEPPPPLRVYTGPDQQDPPTGVLDVRQIIAGELGPYLDKLPEYPED